MGGKDWLGLIFILIMTFLVLNNASNSATILTTLGNQATQLTGTLQGRTSSNAPVQVSSNSLGSFGNGISLA